MKTPGASYIDYSSFDEISNNLTSEGQSGDKSEVQEGGKKKVKIRDLLDFISANIYEAQCKRLYPDSQFNLHM